TSTNRAVLPAGVTVTAGSLAIAASGSPSTVTADATAGAGGGSVSVAGSVAIALVDRITEARLDGAAQLTGALTITAESELEVAVTALPALDGVSGESVGLGASVAVAVVDDATTAAIGAGAAAGAASVIIDAD